MWEDLYFQGMWFLAVQHFLGVISPGPTMAIVIANSIDNRMKGLKTVFGACIGSFTIKSLSILGLAFIIRQSPFLFDAIKIFGGCYLTVLGLIFLRSAYDNWQDYRKDKITHVAASSHSPILRFVKNLDDKPLLVGFLVNMTNPMSSVRFVVIFATAITPDMPLPMQLSYLVVLFAISITYFSLVALFFSEGRIQHLLQRYRFVINTILGATMIYWGSKCFLISMS